MAVSAKLSMVGIYNGELPSTNPPKLVITLSCKITWQIKYVTSKLPQ